MIKNLAIGVVALLLMSPMLALTGVALIFNPASSAECTVASPSQAQVGEVPDELEVETRDGEGFTLDHQQLNHAALIIETGAETEGVTDEGVVIALMAALAESMLRQLTNTSAYPESADYPNDGDGSDHDSLGLFQMRAQTGWGTVEELMDPEYQAAAFYGGDTGPNNGSPRGLLDVPGWQDMEPGEAAQTVEVSAYPDRYANYEPVAEAILETLTADSVESGANYTTITPSLNTQESSRVVFPLPEDTWLLSDDFGPRTHPVTGEESDHAGTDLAAPDGTPILAAADGTVTQASYDDAVGGVVVIEHEVEGTTIATRYLHIWESGIHVTTGETVNAGDYIADVGSAGQSTGPHLHFEVLDGGTQGDPIDPAGWLNEHQAANLPESSITAASTQNCSDDPTGGSDGAAEPGGGGEPGRMVNDPTSDGEITAQMRHVYQQVLDEYSETSWACYAPRPGQDSDHSLGRACDVTFGNPIGSFPTEAQRQVGWEITYWVQDNADALGIDYLIWDGSIWVTSRSDEGWRDYDGGGMHDPDDPTGGHYDHLHISVTE